MSNAVLQERPLTRVGEQGLAGADGREIRPKVEAVSVEDQMPLDIFDVVDLPPTESIRAQVERRRALLEGIPPNNPRGLKSATSQLKLAERELRYGEWRDEQLAKRPDGCQPWCLGRGRRYGSAPDLHDDGKFTINGGMEYCTCPDGQRMRLADSVDHEVQRVQREQEQADRLWSMSGIPPKFREYTLDSLAAIPGKAPLAECLRPWDGRRWLLFTGDVGTCKTGAAVALLQDQLKRGRSGKYIPAPTYFARLRATYNRRQGGDDEADELEVLGSLLQLDVLVLDDLGKEPMSEWAKSRLFTLVNERYVNERTTIVTTNLGREELQKAVGSATYDRLRGEAAPFIKLGGPSVRGIAPAVGIGAPVDVEVREAR